MVKCNQDACYTDGYIRKLSIQGSPRRRFIWKSISRSTCSLQDTQI